MLRSRAIPCLLLRGEGLVKTVRFSRPRYVGDPIHAVRLFNDLQADELLFLDINATLEGRGPNFDRIREIVSDAFMPIGYGGGVQNVEHARRLFHVGVEKVVITTAAQQDEALVSKLADEFGSQSVVVGIDVRRDWLGRRRVVTHAGRKSTHRDIEAYARQVQERGAGEIFLHCVDRDGMQQGYDLELISAVSGTVSVPVVACGGAGSLDDMGRAVRAGASAAAAGSLFVFSGPHSAVLISYPSPAELESCFAAQPSLAVRHSV